MYNDKMKNVHVRSLLNGQFEVRTGKAAQSKRGPDLLALNSNNQPQGPADSGSEIQQLNQRIRRAFGM